jgi:hypothetical protein
MELSPIIARAAQEAEQRILAELLAAELPA